MICTGGQGLCWDPEWLAILKRSHAATPYVRRYGSLPVWGPPTPAEVAAVREALSSATSRGVYSDAASVSAAGSSVGGDALSAYPIHVPFCKTAPTYEPLYPGAEFEPPRRVPQPSFLPLNPQTQALHALLGLLPSQHPGVACTGEGAQPAADHDSAFVPASVAAAPPPDPAEIDLEL